MRMEIEKQNMKNIKCTEDEYLTNLREQETNLKYENQKGLDKFVFSSLSLKKQASMKTFRESTGNDKEEIIELDDSYIQMEVDRIFSTVKPWIENVNETEKDLMRLEFLMYWNYQTLSSLKQKLEKLQKQNTLSNPEEVEESWCNWNKDGMNAQVDNSSQIQRDKLLVKLFFYTKIRLGMFAMKTLAIEAHSAYPGQSSDFKKRIKRFYDTYMNVDSGERVSYSYLDTKPQVYNFFNKYGGEEIEEWEMEELEYNYIKLSKDMKKTFEEIGYCLYAVLEETYRLKGNEMYVERPSWVSELSKNKSKVNIPSSWKVQEAPQQKELHNVLNISDANLQVKPTNSPRVLSSKSMKGLFRVKSVRSKDKQNHEKRTLSHSRSTSAYENTEARLKLSQEMKQSQSNIQPTSFKIVLKEFSKNLGNWKEQPNFNLRNLSPIIQADHLTKIGKVKKRLKSLTAVSRSNIFQRNSNPPTTDRANSITYSRPKILVKVEKSSDVESVTLDLPQYISHKATLKKYRRSTTGYSVRRPFSNSTLFLKGA